MPYIIFMLAIVVADQLIKLAVVSGLGMGNEISIIGGFFYIHCIANNGIAMGIMAGRQYIVIVFTALIMLGIAGYIFKNRKSGDKLMLMSLSGIVGGGIGNIIDRIRIGYVVDYLDFRVWPYIFNFADIFVVVGCFALMFLLFFDGKSEGKKEEK